MCLPEFPGELAIFIEELHPRDEHRRGRLRLLDQHLTARLGLKPGYPRLYRPDGVNFLLLKKGKLVGVLRRQHLRVAAELGDFESTCREPRTARNILRVA